jgi:Flp pilus assembly protein TadG
MFSILLKLARCTSGTATLEGIIVLPLAISLMAGGVEFGRIFAAYGTADKSMRDAARYLARVPRSAVNDWGLADARNLAVYGKLNPADTDQPLIPGWTTDTVTCSTCADVVADNTDVIHLQAAVSYTVLMLSVVGLPNAYTLSVQHEERFIGE